MKLEADRAHDGFVLLAGDTVVLAPAAAAAAAVI